ncbi:MAG: glycosyltransferase family 4 protein [Candidatus Methanofastidiosia archaeon]
MKICIVAPFFPAQKSTEISGIFIRRQIESMIPLGCEFEIICPQRKGLPVYEETESYKVHRVPSFFIPGVRYPLPHFGAVIKKVLNAHADVVEFWGTEYLTAVPSLYIKRRVSAPVTVTVNGLPGISWFYGKGIVDAIGYVHSRVLGRTIIKNADGVRVLCRVLKDTLVRQGVKENRIEIIHIGVDVDTYCPVESCAESPVTLNPEETAIVFLGRLDPVKGGNYLLKAAQNLKGNFKLYFAGWSNPFDVYPELCTPIGNSVKYLGFRKDIPLVLGCADVLAVPSVSEGCPSAVLEASACGIPVVAAEVGAIPELIKDGETGFIVPPKTPEKLQEKLQILIDDEKLRNKMGKTARIHIEHNFKLQKIAEKLFNFYKNVIEEK